MQLNVIETLIIILSIAAGTMITRFTPFLLFPESTVLSPLLTYLGKTLPPAMMGLLVVYCLKHVNLMIPSHGIPEIISISIITFLHLWKRNVLLSIGIGTVSYMFLIQFVFI